MSKYEYYVWDGWALQDLFVMINKLDIVDQVYVEFWVDEDIVEKGCKCGRCFDSDIYHLDIYLQHGDIEYEDERDTE